jgi:predicted Zn-dependent peptidase
MDIPSSSSYLLFKMAHRTPKVTFKKTVFSNGLTLLSERHRGFRSLSIGIWVKTGTRHETPKEAGVSHYLEHMLFKGTENRTALDIARQVDQVGGDFNAFTAREYTCFHILMLDRDLKLGIDILGDVLLNSNFHQDEMERERKVILQEIQMVEESPEEMVHDIFSELIYGKHGLGRPILGTERSIRKMKRADVIKFFRRHYRPDQLIVSVSGDVTHESVMKHIKPLVKRDWPGRVHQPLTAAARSARRKASALHSPPQAPAAKALAATHQLPPKVHSGCWWIERPTEQVHLIWGVAGPPYASKDRFAAFLLNIYLGGGMSSALFQEIREKNGLAYTVYSSLTPYVDSGVFSVYVATGMNQVLLCLKLIEESAEKLKKELLSEEELKTIKDNLKGSVLLASDDVESRMSSIAKNEIFFGKYMPVEEVCRLIDQVTPQDVRRMARKLLSGEGRSVVALGPKPSKQVVTRLRPVRPRQYCRT